MGVVFLFVAAVLAVVMVAVLHHRGYGGHLASARALASDNIRVYGRKLVKAWYEHLLPAIQTARFAAIGLLVLVGVVVLFLDVPMGYKVLCLGLAIIGSAVVDIAGRPEPVNSGAAVITGTGGVDTPPPVAATMVTIPFGCVFEHAPVLTVKSFDPDQEFTLTHVSPKNFSVEIPQLQREDSHFTWRASVRPEGWPALRLIAVLLVVFAAMAAALFAAGFAADGVRTAAFTLSSAGQAEIVSHAITARIFFSLSIPFVAGVFVLFFGVYTLGTSTLTPLASILEFIPAFGMSLTKCAAERSMEPLNDFVDGFKDSSKQVGGLFDQEELKKTRVRLQWMAAAYLVEVYVTSFVDPTIAFFFAWRSVEVFSFGVLFAMEYVEYRYELREKEKGDMSAAFFLGRIRYVMAKIRFGGVITYMAVLAVFTVMAVYSFLDPPRAYAVSKTIIGVFSRGIDWSLARLQSPYTAALAASGLLGAAALAVHGKSVRTAEVCPDGKTKVTVQHSPREKLALPLVVLSLLAFIVGMWGVITFEGNKARAEVVGAGKLITISDLSGSWRNGAAAPHGVELVWSDMRGSHGTRIERRTVEDSGFKVVSPLLALGASPWVDTTAVAGETYYYRLVTKTAAGNIVTEPIKVDPVKAKVKPVVKPVKRTPPVAHPPRHVVVVRSTTTSKKAIAAPCGTSCGSVDWLAVYCRENPGACD